MLLTRAAGSLAAAASLFTLLGTACGSTSDRPGAPGSSAGGNSSAAPGSSGSGGLSLGVGGTNTVGSGASGVHAPTNDCAGDLVEAKYIPLDMYVMLDVSSSMLDPTVGNAAVSKWQAVSSALIDFVNDDESAGIGMGLQLFPIRHPEAPAQCTSNQQCGEFGPCFLNVCWPPGPRGLEPCQTRSQCDPLLRPDGPRCIKFGVCANDTNYICPVVGNACGLDDSGNTDLGNCVAAPASECMITADCRPATYATAAAPIAELPGGSAALVEVIEAAVPDGLTPSGPALTGAIQAASTWAQAHPEHRVVAVLATDGLPTLQQGAATARACAAITEPEEIDAVAQVAADGRAGTPAISTFVIGVFGPNDVSGPTTLNAIASAGGTEQAFLVDTAGNVATQFRDALNAIRASRLSCELQLPEAAAGKKLDYHQINVVFDDGTGPGELDYYVDEAACAGKPGWHYDVDPDPDAPQADGAVPQRIVACPATCAAFGKVDMGSVAIKLGCVTRTPVK